MSDAVMMEENVVEESRLDNVLEVAQKTLRAGIGAAVIAQEEATSLLGKAQTRVSDFATKTQKDATGLLEKMVGRGAEVEQDGRAKLNELMESRKKQVDGTVAEASDSLEGRIETVLHSMNVPTKNDIDALNKKIATLTRKVNQLIKSQQEAAA